MKEASHRFFVRVKNDVEQAAVEEAFGKVDFIQAVDGEYGFVTQFMQEKVFDEKLSHFENVLTVIRANF